MLLGLFLVGTLWFWILMAVAALVVGVCVARESFGKATLSVVATFALLGFLGDFNVLHWLGTHATEFAVYLVAYFAIGTAWSVGKWWFFVRRKRDEYDRQKRLFLGQQGLPYEDTKSVTVAIPEALKAKWREWIDNQYDGRRSAGRSAYPPRARDYKGKITAWMMYWPWSFVVTIVDDPIRKLFNAIFRAIQDVFQRISDSAFKDVKSDFEAPPPKAPPTGGNGRDLKPVPPDPAAAADDHSTSFRS